MRIFSNNATTTLLNSISNVALSLQVASGEGAKFPSPTGGDFFTLTIYKLTGVTESAIEVVHCTGRTGDVFTLVRAQEGTTGVTHDAGDHLQLRVTAAAHNDPTVNTLVSKGTVTAPNFTGLASSATVLATPRAISLTGDVTGTVNFDGSAPASIAATLSAGQVATIAAKEVAANKDASGGYAGLTLFKLNMRNVANTITSWFTNTNAVARTYTLPDADGTVALTSDVALKANIAAPSFTGIVTSAGAINYAAQATVASAATTDIGAATSNSINITGVVTITSLGTGVAGIRRKLTFAGILTLTYNAATLILPTSANIVTAAGDCAEFLSLGSGNWVCQSYTRKSGASLVATSDPLKANLAAPVFTGTISGTDSALASIKTVGFNAEYNNGSVPTAVTITLANGQKQKVTLTGAVPTLTISTAGATVGNYQLRIIQDATGGRIPSYSGLNAARWLGYSTTPSINTVASGETILSMYFDGTNITQSVSHVGKLQ